MGKISTAIQSVLNPKPPLIVSCRGKDGTNNALVVAYACNCSYDPPWSWSESFPPAIRTNL
jgi:hypothetical protein